MSSLHKFHGANYEGDTLNFIDKNVRVSSRACHNALFQFDVTRVGTGEKMGIAKKMASSLTDIGRIVRAAGYSMAGLRAALNKEAAFRQEVILFVILAPLGVWLGRNGIERSLLVGSLLLVLIVELLNSAVEATVDRVSTKRHKLSGRAKDMGSAAVILSILLVVVVWSLVLADRWVF